MGGRGGIGGTIIGAFVIGVLVDGLVVMGYSSFVQNIIKGTVIVAAVFIDLAQIRMQQRIALQKQAAFIQSQE
jgi:erythritol transport system permease protein